MMKMKWFFIVCLLASVGCAKHVPQYFETPNQLVSFSSPMGQKMFQESQHKTDFFVLSNNFESQNNKVFCGPASATIVLNSLYEDELRDQSLKVSPDIQPMLNADSKYIGKKDDELAQVAFNRFTQNNIFDVKDSKVKSRAQVWGAPMPEGKADWGFQLKQLGALISAHGLRSNVYVVNETISVDKMVELMKENLKNPDDYVLINYSRKALSQPGGGHISPIGAYHKASNSFLVMDVNPNKADWVWVKADLLYNSMNTFDTVENRGFLTVSK
ncbi:MAG: phytochelatin synthase family protein [Bdellovibrionales bacterium]|nr:phytochelatin synthase family protein [Bdellovibrionales bacterium]